MAINLKQISTSDSDNIKLDKVNYNFDQLVANGGGPQGPLGPKGDTGFQGVMGPQGFQGTAGSQGFQGPAGDNTEAYWKRINGNNNSLTTDTLFPDAATGALNPPVISIGFLSTDPEYNMHQPLNGGQSPYQWIINRKNHFYSNLRFKSSEVTDNYFDFRIHYDQPSNKTTFRMSFKELGTGIPTRIIWNADNHIFKSNVTGANILSISTNQITLYKDTHFNSIVKINSELYIENANAGVNKIATSVDIDGLVTFKSISELGGTVPYGTIISVLPSVFTDNSRFINTQTINLNQLPNTIDDALKIKVGSGIGDYEGWYLCNGKTWISGVGQSHTVPDLNSFSYNIPDNTASINPNSQGSAILPNDDINIIGGADISMTATAVASGVYSVSHTVQTSNVNINTSTGTTFKIKKLPQIIYLGVGNLYWSDKGTGQAPSALNTFYVDDLNNTSSGAITASSPQTYSQGGSYSFNIVVNAASGYYFTTNPSIGAFTPVSQGYTVTNIVMGGGTYVNSLTLTISVSSQAMNGTDRYIQWNSTSFISVVPAHTVTYRFIDQNTYNGVPTVQITNTAVAGSSTIPLGNLLISTASLSPGMHWTSIPTFTNPVGSGLSFSATIDTADTTEKTIKIASSVVSQPANGAFPGNIVDITYDSLTHKSYDATVTWESVVSGITTSSTANASKSISGNASATSDNIMRINGTVNQYVHLGFKTEFSGVSSSGNGSASLVIYSAGNNPGTIISGPTSQSLYGSIGSGQVSFASYAPPVLLSPGTYRIILTAGVSSVYTQYDYQSVGASAQFHTSPTGNNNDWTQALYY